MFVRVRPRSALVLPRIGPGLSSKQATYPRSINARFISECAPLRRNADIVQANSENACQTDPFAVIIPLMTVLEIVTPPNPILRQPTKPVVRLDAALQILMDNMIETMRAAAGVGLAAPQVGRTERLAVIETLPKVDKDGVEIENSRELFVIINPEIVWASDTVVDGIEGCLSIPGFVGEVTRSQSVRVKALDRHGRKMKLRINGWSARIFQHEIDHLDGVLYIDRLTAPENFWREEEYYGVTEGEEEGAHPPV